MSLLVFVIFSQPYPAFLDQVDEKSVQFSLLLVKDSEVF